MFSVTTETTHTSNVPFPFCHAVYQERLRKDVKKIIAVATVPFLSLISFQRCLSSAELSGTPELPLPPSLRVSLYLSLPFRMLRRA